MYKDNKKNQLMYILYILLIVIYIWGVSVLNNILREQMAATFQIYPYLLLEILSYVGFGALLGLNNLIKAIKKPAPLRLKKTNVIITLLIVVLYIATFTSIPMIIPMNRLLVTSNLTVLMMFALTGYLTITCVE